MSNPNVKATITIYKKSILTPEKNYALDKGKKAGRSIENYLSTLTSQTITNVNYQKQGLLIDVKLDINQAQLEMGEDDKDWNYMKIQNGSENPLYYFITNKEWIAKDTIKFSLSMDTLNSFEFNVDYLINPKTKILRQHKDRLKAVSGYSRGNQMASDFAYATSPKYNIATGTYSFGNDLNDIPNAIGYIVLVYFYNEDYPAVYLPYDNYETQYDTSTHTWGIKVNTAFDSGLPHSDTSMNAEVYPLYQLYERDIDLLSEGINAPVYKTELGNIIDKEDDVIWYLLYRNTQQPDPSETFNNSPVEAFLIPDQPRAVHVYSGKNLTTGELTSDYYLIDATYNPDASFIINSTKYTPKREYIQRTNRQNESLKENYIVLHISGGTITFEWWQYLIIWYSNGSVRYEKYQKLASETANNVTFNSDKNEVYLYESNSDPHTAIHDTAIPTYNKAISFTGGTNYTLNAVGSVDRTDSRNIKLIALPYCPAMTQKVNGYLNFDGNFSYDSDTGWMKVNNIAKKFSNTLSHNLENPFESKFVFNLVPHTTDMRNDLLESKLYHSDYFRYKFIYDSFSRMYELEKYDFTPYFNSRYKEIPQDTITFVMTRTINSKFLFKFDTTYLVNSVEDYDGVCCISRNNEEPLYNSAYINYIKAGYNYDKKSVARTTEANKLGIGLSVASMITGILASIATENPAPAILSAVGAGIGIASQTASMVRTTAQGEQAIQQKLEETSRQAVSVAGSDDIDLLTAYSDNKAKLVLYQVSDRMNKALADMFYYCGYKLEVQDIPNKSSRYWFNFVQAELVINESANISADIEDDIKVKFSQGVTFFHYRNSFNFEQDKENYETSIVGG